MKLPVQLSNVGYGTVTKLPALSPPSNKQLAIYSAKAINQTVSSASAGICKILDPSSWTFAFIVAASTPQATDGTAGIQKGSTTTAFSTVNNGGFLVGSNQPFNIVGMTITQASTGSPVYTVKYFNGTNYVVLPVISGPTLSSTGDTLIVFVSPYDWVPGTTVSVGGNASQYNLLVQASTAPTQAVNITALWVAQFLLYRQALNSNSELVFSLADYQLPLILSGKEGLAPYFSPLDPTNQLQVLYSVEG